MKAECPIWNTPAKLIPGIRDGIEISSSRTSGRYFVTGTAKEMLAHCNICTRLRLTTWIVDQHRLGIECPEITSATLEYAKTKQPLSVLEQADKLLAYFACQSEFIGDEVPYVSDDHSGMEALAWSETSKNEEVAFLLSFLELEHLIHFEPSGDEDGEITITVAGYSRLAEIERKPNTLLKQAFIAMWFSQETEEIRAVIKLAIEDAGYEALVIDEKPHNNKIDDEIIAEIRRSRFLIADFTHGDSGMRGGVYYEAGFARGLGLPVISTCRQNLLDESQIHFDTRQYNHIGWKNDQLESFRKTLASRISATIGDGPLRAKK
jgi:nucleoside 2-deoxyribosyltransferase